MRVPHLVPFHTIYVARGVTVTVQHQPDENGRYIYHALGLRWTAAGSGITHADALRQAEQAIEEIVGPYE